MKRILVLFVLLFVGNCFGQTPNWVWGRQAMGTSSQEGLSVATDVSGNVYATGTLGISTGTTMIFDTTTLIDTGLNDIFIVKYDSNGNRLWAKRIGGSGIEVANSIATDFHGNVYLAGYFASSTISFDTIILTNTGSDDIFLAKYDSNGNVLWAKSATGNNSDIGYSVTTDVQGNVYLGGMFYSPTITFDTITVTNTGGWDMLIVKYDENGNPLWAKSANGNNTDVVYSIATDTSSNVYVTGYFASTTLVFGTYTLTNMGGADIFIVKYDKNGNVIWGKSEGGSASEAGNSIATDETGVYLTGYFNSPTIIFGSTTLTNSGSNDMYIAKYSQAGTVLWANSAGGNGIDNGYGVSTNTSGIYLTGGFKSSKIIFGLDTLLFPTGATDPMFLIKYDINGNVICASSLASGGDDVCAVATDGFGNVYIAGDFEGANTFIIGADILTESSGELFFIAKYNCNSTTVPVNELTNPESLSLYPNPANTSFTIESTNKIQSITVINVIGEVVSTSSPNGNSKTTIDLTRVAKGIYFVQITDENKTVENKKIVVQ